MNCESWVNCFSTGDFYAGMDFSLRQKAEHRQRHDQRIVGKEIYNNVPKVREFVVGPISEGIADNPDAVTFVIVAAESGIGKLEIIAGIIDELENSAPLNEALANQGKELQIHYTSTAKCAKNAEKRGKVRKGHWGRYDPDTELPEIFKIEKHGAIFSAIILPELYPKKTHVVVVEALSVADDLLFSLAQNKNSFFIFPDSEVAVMKNTLLLREIIWDSTLTNDQKAKRLATKGIIFDSKNFEETKYSGGNANAILLVNEILNYQMITDKGKFPLPRGIEDYTLADLENKPELRMALQRAYYDYKIRKLGLKLFDGETFTEARVLHTSNPWYEGTILNSQQYVDGFSLNLDEVLNPDSLI